MDPRGIEPLSALCHSAVLPVYYGPVFTPEKTLLFLVDRAGVEPAISTMRMWRITNCANGPHFARFTAYYTINYLRKESGLTATPFLRTSK